MQKKPFVKLGFAVLIAAAVMFGIRPAPARASSCPSSYGTCFMFEETCDEGECCCHYVDLGNPNHVCRDYCS